MTNAEKVLEFFTKFGIACPDAPRVPESEFFLFRFQHMHEELNEVLQAYRNQDVAALADGLADLIYLAYGLALNSGVPIDAVFEEVHRANMTKVRAKSNGDPLGKRGSHFDIVKPLDFAPPDVAGVLKRYGG